MSEYFAKWDSLVGNIKAELNLSDYAIKVDFKKAPGVDTSVFAKKAD